MSSIIEVKNYTIEQAVYLEDARIAGEIHKLVVEEMALGENDMDCKRIDTLNEVLAIINRKN